MSSLLEILGIQDDGGLNVVIALPVVVVFLAVAFLLKLNVPKSENFAKCQNVKKQQKLTNKQKDDKVISDKKYKINREAKVVHSATKTLEVETDTIKLKNKRQPVGVEKSPKKSFQTKKQQVNNAAKRSPTKNNQFNKKQLESLINNDEGEWQMVTTKKQKQMKQDDSIETNAAKLNKKPQHSPEKANKMLNKTKKVEIEHEKFEAVIQYVNCVDAPLELKQVVSSEPNQVEETTTPVLISSSIIQQEIVTPEPLAENKVASSENAESAPSTDLIINRLEDDGWTDTKPQRKNRRKVLRE